MKPKARLLLGVPGGLRLPSWLFQGPTCHTQGCPGLNRLGHACASLAALPLLPSLLWVCLRPAHVPLWLRVGGGWLCGRTQPPGKASSMVPPRIPARPREPDWDPLSQGPCAPSWSTRDKALGPYSSIRGGVLPPERGQWPMPGLPLQPPARLRIRPAPHLGCISPGDPGREAPLSRLSWLGIPPAPLRAGRSPPPSSLLSSSRWINKHAH